MSGGPAEKLLAMVAGEVLVWIQDPEECLGHVCSDRRQSFLGRSHLKASPEGLAGKEAA